MQIQNKSFTKDFIVVEHKESFNLHGDSVQDLKLTMDINTLHSGIIAQLGVYNFSVLVCIASHMDSKGLCFPSQRKISELTGISINKVTKCVKELLATEIDGQPLFVRTFAQGIKGKKTVYTFQQDNISVEALQEATQEVTEAQTEELTPQVEEKPQMTAKDVVVHYAEKYQSTFGDGYIISWGKEMKLVKEKLLPNFEAEDIKKMIDVAVSQYPTKWANQKYPRPSISMVCGWLGKEAFKIVLAEKKQQQSMQIRIDSMSQAETEMDKFLNM